MNTKKIGNLISKLRKEKGLSQQSLADKLGVSPKTISKWECGNGLPDIAILKKVSDTLGITIEELLDGKQNNEYISEKNKSLFIFIIVLSIVMLTIIFSLISISKNTEDNKLEYNCEVLRTYYVDNISESNDGNYRYITVHEFQVEGTYTIKLPRSISETMEESKSYIFTFKTTEDYVISKTDSLFNNSEIINVIYTDKEGLQQEYKYHCNK